MFIVPALIESTSPGRDFLRRSQLRKPSTLSAAVRFRQVLRPLIPSGKDEEAFMLAATALLDATYPDDDAEA
jgi:hypothetical protein